VCFGVKLDKLLLDSHKRVKKDKEKNFKKKQKFFSLVCSRRSQISRHFHHQRFSFEKKKKLKKKEKTRRTQKNHKEPPHLFFSNNHKTRTNATKVIMRLKDEDY